MNDGIIFYYEELLAILVALELNRENLEKLATLGPLTNGQLDMWNAIESALKRVKRELEVRAK